MSGEADVRETDVVNVTTVVRNRQWVDVSKCYVGTWTSGWSVGHRSWETSAPGWDEKFRVVTGPGPTSTRPTLRWFPRSLKSVGRNGCRPDTGTGERTSFRPGTTQGSTWRVHPTDKVRGGRGVRPHRLTTVPHPSRQLGPSPKGLFTSSRPPNPCPDRGSSGQPSTPVTSGTLRPRTTHLPNPERARD